MATPGMGPVTDGSATTPISELVVLSAAAWNDPRSRERRLVREMLALRPELKVLFVEPLLSTQAGRVHVDVVGLEDRRPVWRLRPGGRRLLRKTSAPGWAEVRRTAKRLGFDDPVVWVTDGRYSTLVAKSDLPVVSHADSEDRATHQADGKALLAALDRARAGQHPVRHDVWYLDHCAQLSGGELALLRLLPSLDRVNPKVVLAQDGPLVAELREAGVQVEVKPLAERARGMNRRSVVPGLDLLRSAPPVALYTVRLSRELRRQRPDLVHTNSLKAALYGGIAGRLASVPVVWHMRDRIAPDYLPRPTVALVRLLARLLPRAVIANSGSTLSTLGDLNKRAEVIPSPVIYDSVHVAAGRPAPPSHVLRIAMVGRIAEWKGQHILIEALARAFPGGGANAVIVGSAMFGEDDEAYERTVRRLVHELGLEERVSFLGFRDDVSSVLSAADVLVHASVVPEPFGQVVVEGLAAGLPVVASAAGGPSEIITDGVDGILVEPGSVTELAEALKRLAEDGELRRRLVRAGVRRAEAFRPDALAPRVQDLYADLLGSRGR